jgi:hypothetical protein
LRRARLHRQGGALGRRAGYARRLTPRLALAVVFIVFAAAGLSSLEGNDFCNINRGPGTSAQTALDLWPPGRECTVTLADARVSSRDAGDIAGFLAILAAGLVFVLVRRRSNLALCTAMMFGTTGLTSFFVSQVPAFGFGWMIGGFVGHHLTRSVPGTLTAAGALAVGGILQIVGAGPWGWAAVLLALLAVPTPYEER